MYICAKCNSQVDQPGKRWWSGWRYCAKGHILYVGGLGSSLERSFWMAFARAFGRSFLFFSVIVLTAAIAPDNDRTRSGAPAMGFLVAAFYLIAGLFLLGKAHVWTGRAGPVEKLLPHMRGRAYGFLVAVTCQLGISIVLLSVK